MKKNRIFYRDAVTGYFVSREYAEANPSTTVREVREYVGVVSNEKKNDY